MGIFSRLFESKETKATRRQKSQFFLAIRRGDLETVESLLAASPELVSCRADEPTVPSPLRVACAVVNPNIVESLLRHRANISERDSGGETILHLAAFVGNPVIVEMLLTTGTDVNAMGNVGCTAIHQLIQGLQVPPRIMAQFPEERRFQLLKKDPACLARMLERRDLTLALLLGRGANPNLHGKFVGKPLDRLTNTYVLPEMPACQVIRDSMFAILKQSGATE